jgi:hypothetical protein
MVYFSKSIIAIVQARSLVMIEEHKDADIYLVSAHFLNYPNYVSLRLNTTLIVIARLFYGNVIRGPGCIHS